MIDFRYHLVSLVSVFLALAVGIVLGAGPLKDPIDATIKNDVESLRAEKDGLKQELDRLDSSQQHRDDFLDEISPVLVGQRLSGRSVALVVLPGAEKQTADDLETVLQQAGAKVTTRVSVAEKWTEPDQAAFRDQLASQLQSTRGAGDTGAATTPDRLANLLARSVLTDDPARSGKPDTPARTVLDGLTSADLVSVDGEPKTLATVAVLLAPPVPEAVHGAATATDEPLLTAWAALAHALDTGSNGATVLGPPSSTADGGLLHTLRDDPELSADLSTVDTAGTPMGNLTTVLALGEQLRGGSGSYGFADGAKQPLPDIIDDHHDNG